MVEKNLKYKELTIKVPAETRPYLEKLIETGVHGQNPTEVARTLIWDGIKALFPNGVMNWKGPS
jgi:hypothetical protein